METVAQPPAEAELQLLTRWGEPDDGPRRRKAAVLSILVHVVVLNVLAFLPEGPAPQQPPETARRVTPLIEPPTELTQKAPNQGKVSKEFNAVDLTPRPRIVLPPRPPVRAFLVAPRPTSRPAPAVPLPEPPKTEAAINPLPRTDLPVNAPPPPPQIQTEEQPKLVLENVGSAPATVAPGQGRVPIPNTSVSSAIRQTARAGGGGAGMTVGDQDLSGPGLSPSVNLPPSPGVQGSNMQLLSDPMGVDFRPYLMRILAAVRQNWFAVMPEAVKLGRRGRVGVLFGISREGAVTKANFAYQSGTDALDRAAIAAISMSNPFPPLPPDFQGDRIVLQFNFSYNMPKQ